MWGLHHHYPRGSKSSCRQSFVFSFGYMDTWFCPHYAFRSVCSCQADKHLEIMQIKIKTDESFWNAAYCIFTRPEPNPWLFFYDINNASSQHGAMWAFFQYGLKGPIIINIKRIKYRKIQWDFNWSVTHTWVPDRVRKSFGSMVV